MTHVDRLSSAAPQFVLDMRRHQRRNFVLLLLDGALFALAASFLAETTIIPTFLDSIVRSPVIVGAVIAVYALGNSLPQIAGAHLLQGRLRRKPLLLALAAAERAGILGIALSAQLADIMPAGAVVALFLVAFGGYATTTGLLGPVYGEVLAKTIVDWRGHFYGAVQLIGGVLGFTAALVAESVIRASPGLAGFQMLFWSAFVLSLISIVFLAFTRDAELAIPVAVEGLLPGLRRIPSTIAGDPLYRRFLASRIVIALGGLALGFVVLDAIDRGVSVPQVGLLTAVLIGAQATLGFVFGLVGTRFGWHPVLVIGSALLCAGMLGAVVAHGVLAYCLVFMALGGFRASMLIVDPNLSIECAPLGRTAHYLAITATVLAPFLVVGPLAGGALIPVVGTTPIFAVAAILALVGLGLALRVRAPR